MNFIRWIAMLPGAILAAAVVAFPIHWVVMSTLGGWGRDPIVEIRDISTLRAIELFLQGLFGPFVFVYAAAFIAPSQRLLVSITAGLVVVIGAGGLAMWINSLNDPRLSVQYGIVEMVSNVAGALGAILLIKAFHTSTRAQKHELEPGESAAISALPHPPNEPTMLESPKQPTESYMLIHRRSATPEENRQATSEFFRKIAAAHDKPDPPPEAESPQSGSGGASSTATSTSISNSQPMTLRRANEIVDRIEAVLLHPERARGVGRGKLFRPISQTGASTRFELAHAMYIVVAQLFEKVSTAPEHSAKFTEFVRGASGSLLHVLLAMPLMTDAELRLISTLQENTKEFSAEDIRLSELATNDGTMELETIDSFVSFLKTLNPQSRDYWSEVYQHIGIDNPHEA